MVGSSQYFDLVMSIIESMCIDFSQTDETCNEVIEHVNVRPTVCCYGDLGRGKII